MNAISVYFRFPSLAARISLKFHIKQIPLLSMLSMFSSFFLRRITSYNMIAAS
jgi:hypothetical protein